MTWFIARAVPKVQCIERNSAAVFQWFYFLMEGNKLTMNSYTAKKNMTKTNSGTKCEPKWFQFPENTCVFGKFELAGMAEFKRLPAQVLCQELASWNFLRGSRFLNFLRGSRFLAGIFCEEAGSWQEVCARRQVPGRNFVPGSTSLHFWFVLE